MRAMPTIVRPSVPVLAGDVRLFAVTWAAGFLFFLLLLG